MKRIVVFAALLCSAVFASAQVGNFPPLIGAKGASTPTNCTVGQLFFKTGVTAGQNIYGCTSTNTWTAEGGAGGTVTSVSVTTANGVSGTVVTATTTPAISLLLGAITPTSVTAISATELAPALTAGNWTVGSGWESPIVGPGLIKNADGTGTQTPSAATNIVAGTTYKVTITLSAASAGSATYTIGGVAGTSTLSAVTTYTDYVTASTTGKLIITPTNTSRFTISAISILAVGDYKGTVGIGNPLPGAFTTVTATGLSANQIPVAGTGGLLGGSSSLTFGSSLLTVGGGISASGAVTVTGTANAFVASVSAATLRANLTNGQNSGTTAFSSINNSGKLMQTGIYGSTAAPAGAILAGSGFMYTDSTVGMSIGTGAAVPISLFTGTALLEQVRILDTASAVNYVGLTGGITTAAPVISAQGETNVPLTITSKGSGTVTINATGSGSLTFGSGVVAPASSGTRYLCISTAGVVTSSAVVCSGT